MVPAPGGVSYGVAAAWSTFCVSGVHDLPGHKVPHELPDVPCAMVSPLSFMGDLQPDIVVEVSLSDQTSYDKIHSPVVCPA